MKKTKTKTLESAKQVNDVRVATVLLEVEAHTTLARAHLLRQDNKAFWENLLKARELMQTLVNALVNPDGAGIEYFFPTKANRKKRAAQK